MRRLLVLLLGTTLIAAACASDDERVAVADPIPTGSVMTPTSSVVTPTTLPSTSTTPRVEELDDPLETAVQLLADQWSTLEIWGDGWVELRAVVSGAPVVDRDSDVGMLFPDEVFDAIEDAGAADVLEAFNAVSQAGLLSVVLEVLDEHPDAWDEILTGSATIEMRSRTTLDGEAWVEEQIPFLAEGRLLGSGSDGEHLALVLRAGNSEVAKLATTTDLIDWTITELPLGPSFGGGEIAAHRIADGWYVLPSQDEAQHDAWVVDDAGIAQLAVAPFDGGGFAVESTDAGLIAWGPETNGVGRLMFSADGLAWQERSAPAAGPITGIAAVDGGLVVGQFVSESERPVFTGTPDGREWVVADLPAEIDFPVWIQDAHHRGVVQRVAPQGRGRGGAIRPVVEHTTVVEHDGLEFRFEYDGFDMVATVADAATGALVGVSESTYGDDFSYSRFRLFDDEMRVIGGSGEVLGALPRELYVSADADAVADALAGLPAEEIALVENRYVLVSFDGRTWQSLVLQPAAEGEVHFIRSVNGSRVLLTDGTDHWVREIDDE